jgi:hypothetical protein
MREHFLSTNISVGDFSLALQIWDTARQEPRGNLIPTYRRNTGGAILAFDLTCGYSPRVGRCRCSWNSVTSAIRALSLLVRMAMGGWWTGAGADADAEIGESCRWIWSDVSEFEQGSTFLVENFSTF